LKIVLGAHHYPPDRVAGVELIAQRQARWLAAQGHQVEVVTVGEIDAPAALTHRVDVDEGVVVHRLGLQLTGASEPLSFRYRDEVVGRWFAEYLGRSRPDLFHSHSSYVLSATPIRVAKQMGIPTMLTLHDYWFLCPRITLLRPNGERRGEPGRPEDCAWCLMTEHRRFRAVDTVLSAVRGWGGSGSSGAPTVPPRWLTDRGLVSKIQARQSYLEETLGSADQLATPSRFAYDLLVSRGYPAARVRLVPYGLAPTADARGDEGFVEADHERGLRVGYLGQLAEHKGVHVLVRAFQSLTRDYPNSRLEIHGDEQRFPRYASELRRLASANSAIRFSGPYQNSQVSQILGGLDVVVVSSTWFEIYPLVVLEAFAAGVTVIATRLPNLQNMIRDEVDGLLFGADDSDDLARQLRRLIVEPDLLPRLRAGIAPVRSFDDEMSETVGIYAGISRTPDSHDPASERRDPAPGESMARHPAG